MNRLVLCSESETLHNYRCVSRTRTGFVFWEGATAHAGAEARAEMGVIFARDGLGEGIPAPVEQSEVHWLYVRDAALQLLIEWADTGLPPPEFPPIDVAPGVAARLVRQCPWWSPPPHLEALSATNTGVNNGIPSAALSRLKCTSERLAVPNAVQPVRDRGRTLAVDRLGR